MIHYCTDGDTNGPHDLSVHFLLDRLIQVQDRTQKKKDILLLFSFFFFNIKRKKTNVTKKQKKMYVCEGQSME